MVTQSPNITIKLSPDQTTANQEFIYNFLVTSLSKAFENVSTVKT